MFKTYSSSSSLVITSRWFATSRLRAPVSVRLVYFICYFSNYDTYLHSSSTQVKYSLASHKHRRLQRETWTMIMSSTFPATIKTWTLLQTSTWIRSWINRYNHSLLHVVIHTWMSNFPRIGFYCNWSPVVIITVKPVYNDHLMGYFSAFWSSSRWPRAT